MTPAALRPRTNDREWNAIEKVLLAEPGTTLFRDQRLKRAYPDRGQGPVGGIGSLTEHRLAKFERAGVLTFVGVNRYTLSDAHRSKRLAELGAAQAHAEGVVTV